MLKQSIPGKSLCRPADHLLKQGIRDFTRRKNTRLVIDGTSTPVVSRSTVTTMLGNSSSLNSRICCSLCRSRPVIFIIALGGKATRLCKFFLRRLTTIPFTAKTWVFPVLCPVDPDDLPESEDYPIERFRYDFGNKASTSKSISSASRPVCMALSSISNKSDFFIFAEMDLLFRQFCLNNVRCVMIHQIPIKNRLPIAGHTPVLRKMLHSYSQCRAAVIPRPSSSNPRPFDIGLYTVFIGDYEYCGYDFSCGDDY